MVCGGSRVPIQTGDAIIFVETCAKGCPPSDLSVTIRSVANEKGHVVPLEDGIQVCCNFCGQRGEMGTVSKATADWDETQRDLKNKSKP